MIEEYLKQQQAFWQGLANQWSPDNRDPVVGWYDQHEAFPHYDTVLFRGIDTKGKRALEYGCGPGRNIRRFADRFQRIDGVDISPVNIEKAKTWCAVQNLPFTPFLWANDGAHLPFIPDETYDVVFAVIALQHVNHHGVRQKIYEEVYRVLKEGGYFCFQVGFGPGHPRSLAYHAEPKEYKEADFRLENLKDMVDDLKDAGFGEGAFSDIEFQFTEPCCDEHPQWVWFKAQK